MKPMEIETLEILLHTEPRLDTRASLCKLTPFLALQAKILGVKLNTSKGLKKSLRSLNRSLSLN